MDDFIFDVKYRKHNYHAVTSMRGGSILEAVKKVLESIEKDRDFEFPDFVSIKKRIDKDNSKGRYEGCLIV